MPGTISSRLRKKVPARLATRAYGAALESREGRARHRVEDEFHGGVYAALVPPNADQQRHGNQHHFPEKEEEEEIQREKHADNADFQHQQHHKKFLDAVLDAFP